LTLSRGTSLTRGRFEIALTAASSRASQSGESGTGAAETVTPPSVRTTSTAAERHDDQKRLVGTGCELCMAILRRARGPRSRVPVFTGSRVVRHKGTRTHHLHQRCPRGVYSGGAIASQTSGFQVRSQTLARVDALDQCASLVLGVVIAVPAAAEKAR